MAHHLGLKRSQGRPKIVREANPPARSSGQAVLYRGYYTLALLRPLTSFVKSRTGPVP